MEFTGRLITGDFEENTMTFEIEGEITLQAGRYKIVQIAVGNQVKNNVGLADVVSMSKCCNVDCEEPTASPDSVYCEFHGSM
jgi:hypothetical protein